MNEKAVSGLRAADGGAQPTVRVPSAQAPAGKGSGPRGQVPAAPARSLGRVRPASEAWFKIAEPLRRRKGVRVVFFGITGKGKTHGIADFLDYVRAAKLIELVLVHDVKESEKQFEGRVIYGADDAFSVEMAATEYPATFVLRRRTLDHMPSMERLARRTLEAGYGDVTTMAVLDEWRQADKDAPSVERLFSEGRGLHASIVVGKQLPMGMPNWARAQADLVVFGLNGAGAEFLADPPLKSYDKPTADVVRRLDERQFIVVPQEGDFDGQVYEVPIR